MKAYDPALLAAASGTPEAIQDDVDDASARDELWGVVGTISMLEMLYIDDDDVRDHLRVAKHHLRVFLGADVAPGIRVDEATTLLQEMLLDITEEWGEDSEKATAYRARVEDIVERGETYREDVQTDLAEEDLERRRAMLDRSVRRGRVVPLEVAEELENTVAYPEAVTTTITSSDLPDVDPDELDAAAVRHEERS